MSDTTHLYLTVDYPARRVYRHEGETFCMIAKQVEIYQRLKAEIEEGLQQAALNDLKLEQEALCLPKQ